MRKIFNFKIFIFILALFSFLSFGFFFVQKDKIGFAAVQIVEEDNEPPVISNVEIEDVSATGTVIKWNTDEESDSLINYGLDKNYGIVRDPHFDKTEHKIILENLLPGMTYYFRITSSDASGNQGISSDFSFKTPKEEEPKEGEDLGEKENSKLAEEGEGASAEGEGGQEQSKDSLSEEGVEKIVELMKEINSEEDLEKIKEELQNKAEDIIEPPTIMLDYADVEVGVDWAIISWETDKESNSMVGLASEDDFDETLEDPYTWHEGNPDELVLEHVVEINGLEPATTYHFQVSSKSAMDLTGRSADKTFKTKSILPEIYNIQIAKIEEESATIKWTTNVPCSAIVEYTNLNTNETKMEGNSSFLTVHSMRLSNLTFDTYYSAIIKVESEEGEKAESAPMTFITTRDKYPPTISKVNTESTLYPGNENKIQTIASWRTDENAKCQLFYHQGLISAGKEPNSLPLEEDYGIKHVQVITSFLPASVYKFWIVCEDEAENKAKSEDFTMLTPSREESIIDIIIKNFESSFGWVKKMRM